MRDLFFETLRSLCAHGFRYALTALGIVWGTALLTYLSAVVGGSEQHFISEIEEVGPRLVFVFSGIVTKEGVGERGARPIRLELEDLARLEALASVEAADPNITLWNSVVRAGIRTRLLTVFGVTSSASAVRNFEVAEGRFITRVDGEERARVAFLGPKAAQRLFGGAPAVGRTLQIESVRFRVIGVARGKGDQLINVQGQDDLAVLVPHTTLVRWFQRSDDLDMLLYTPRTREESWDSLRDVREVLGLHHRFAPTSDTALSFFNTEEAMRIVRTLFSGLALFLSSAGLATLLVGSVGVMNIMLVVVRERRSEIGLRKAVGASDRAIFLQFLAEGVAVSAVAGIVGTVLGVGLVHGSVALLPPDAPLAPLPVLDPRTIVVTSTSLILTSVVAAVLPALRAARIPPAESLRSA